jgi:formate hydrogenlyase subunit 4
MGAAREVTFACLGEPAIFLAFLALAKLTGTLSLFSILSGVSLGTGSLWAPLLLVVAGIFIVLLAENCRIPVDDPNTHLELTMIHEVMVLDHSGPMLGFIQYGAALKFFSWVLSWWISCCRRDIYSASSELEYSWAGWYCFLS